MSRNVYIAATESSSGKSAIALGVMEMMVKKVGHVGFFRPIIAAPRGGEEQDNDIALITSHFRLDIPYEEAYAFTSREAGELIQAGKTSVLIEGILAKYNAIAARFDFVVCEGSDYEGETSAFEFNINAEIARNIDAPVFLIMNGNKLGAEGQLTGLDFAVQSFREGDCKVLAAILNRYPAGRLDELPARLRASRHADLPVYALPEDPLLAAPMMSEVAHALGAQTFFRPDLLDSLQATSFSVADSSPELFLSQLQDGALLFISGDRFGNLLGVMLRLNSAKPVNIAGIVLTNGFKPAGAVATLLTEIKNMVPVLSVPGTTFEAVTTVSRLHSRIYPGATRKITTALALFESCVDTRKLVDLLATAKTGVVTPKMFEFGLIQRAQAPRQRIVLPEGEEDRILYATEQVIRRGIADVILLGNAQKIRSKISHLGLNLPGVEIIQPLQSPHFRDFVNAYAELRQSKGMTSDMAETIMVDVSYFGTMMVYKGLADGMVSGSVNTTAHTVRPALQFIRTKPGFTIVSSVFFMCLKDRVLVYGDCAINPNPTAQQLAEIAVTSARTAQTFGVEPRVAMLSYSTGASGGGADVERVREATELAHRMAPELPLEGPIQYDAAIDAEVARTKMPESKVAGQATVFIFPDLNTGNNTYKAVQRSAGAVAIGPVIQGLRKPVNDLSRGCTVTDIVNTVAITAIQAQAEK
ncbi:MAG: phosphate acetyltransferase [Kiritimatiellae bacterium]|jgi:phosphate acetyltransferase|nr:phosphate acetyltransferase [Kiritimatiellia bacterium]NLD89889.1 phosphate acetyltransferase [Lentisphaerota bacterium]HPC18937.1 phosphate acetyltransferase [Kiritimatiellia bacterium]HQQ61346.1 phosphate acetyltransferase [Kiritimatiellia bacterium]